MAIPASYYEAGSRPLSPLFLVPQHGAGLVVAAFGAFALISRRGFPGLQFASLVSGSWVLISSFIPPGPAPT